MLPITFISELKVLLISEFHLNWLDLLQRNTGIVMIFSGLIFSKWHQSDSFLCTYYIRNSWVLSKMFKPLPRNASLYNVFPRIMSGLPLKKKVLKNGVCRINFSVQSFNKPCVSPKIIFFEKHKHKSFVFFTYRWKVDCR